MISNFVSFPLVFQQYILSILELHLSSEQASFLQGLFFGKGVVSNPELTTLFASVGLSHLLSASGYNLSLVYRCIKRLFSMSHPVIVLSMSLLSIWLYAWIAGFGPPVCRAAVQLSLILCLKTVGRKPPVFLCLIYSGAILLFIRPNWFSSLSFWLSFLATTSLLLFSPDQNEGGKAIGLESDLKTTLAASLLVNPVICLVFGTFSPISYVANVLILWSIPYWMVLAVGLVVSQLLVPGLSGILSFFMSEILEQLFSLLNFLGSLPFATIETGENRGVFVLFMGLVCIFLLYMRKLHQKKRDLLWQKYKNASCFRW